MVTHSSLIAPMDKLVTPSGEASAATFIIVIFMVILMLNFYEEIPPVTLCVMAIHVLLHKRILYMFNVKLLDVCMNTMLVWNREQWYRVFVAPLYHANDYHLGICLLSFYVKGSSLEWYFGSQVYAGLIVCFAVMVNVVTIPVSYVLEYYLHDPSFISRCTIGFSGVVFAMKVLITMLFQRRLDASWIELPIICLLMPKLTSVANLAGVVVGLQTVIVMQRVSRYQSSGPLNWVHGASPLNWLFGGGPRGHQRYDIGAGGRDPNQDIEYWYQPHLQERPAADEGFLWPFGQIIRRPAAGDSSLWPFGAVRPPAVRPRTPSRNRRRTMSSNQ